MAQPISEEDQLISRLEELGAEYAQLHAAEAYEQDLRQQRSQKRAIKPEPNPEEATYLVRNPLFFPSGLPFRS